ncbi:hypothetical protein Pfo_011248 [Paulownia fortunei]|nr:hypothetical protein Pfo_011248 [Paulownia fortunei]
MGKAILIEPIFAQWIQSAHGLAFNVGRSIWIMMEWLWIFVNVLYMLLCYCRITENLTTFKSGNHDKVLVLKLCMLSSFSCDYMMLWFHKASVLNGLSYNVVKILNDITGNLDAKKACMGAMKLHKKYLRKAKNA